MIIRGGVKAWPDLPISSHGVLEEAKKEGVTLLRESTLLTSIT